QRFKHWLLDKKNIKTVVVRRWLKKDEKKGKILKTLIDKRWHAIKDGAVLDTIKDPNQEYIVPKKDDLYETYPFIPYQFPLIIQVTQTLIREKLVEELYGGRTRSILVMVRDVLNNKLEGSSKMHFIDENLGRFVTLPQIYDTITLTLKRKDEDQFNLVENTKLLIEDPAVFSAEERAIPISYLDVAKTVLLMGMTSTPDGVKIPVDDGNIMKALFYSLDLPKSLFSKKIKKLISKLKKEGYLIYKKRIIKDKDGKQKEINEYSIPSRKIREKIEDARKIAVSDSQIQIWLKDFFKEKEGRGISLIEFTKEQYLPSILGPGNKVIDLERAIKLKLEWNKYLDISIDEIMGKLPDEKDTVAICLLTDKTIEKYKSNTRKLTAKIKAMTKKAMDLGKLLIFITPNLSRTPSSITHSLNTLVNLIKDCICFQEALHKEMDGDVSYSFNQWVIDWSREILGILRANYESGSIFYADKEDKIDSNKINDTLSGIIKKIYSWLNPQAYLGQIRVKKEQLKFILTWDPKKNTTIPIIFKKAADSRRQYKNIPMFDNNDIKPNQCPQYNYIINVFKKYKREYPRAEKVPAEHFYNTFNNPPYSWNETVLLAIIAGILRSGEWDVIKGSSIKNPDDEEIINAFTDWKSKYEKFRELKFQVAETIDQSELINAQEILKSLFSEHISQVGRDMIDDAIRKVMTEYKELYLDVKPELEKFSFGPEIISSIEIIKKDINKILKNERVVSRIKAFINRFHSFVDQEHKKEMFESTRKLLYRIRELKISNELEKYHILKRFLNKTFSDWLRPQHDRNDYNELTLKKNKILEQLGNKNVLWDDGWETVWNNTKTLWETYWKSYIELHQKLFKDIDNAKIQIQNKIKETG
ncbi:MAG: hypothetical protein ACTSRA_20250, partial [Promethearchaeota archaeon]